MPDPHKDLADIVPPAPPPVPEQPVSPGRGLPLAIVLGALVLGLGLAWHSRRTAQLRALRHIAADARDGRGEVVALADGLAEVARRRYRLERLDQAASPAALQGEAAAAWRDWVAALDTLRFAPPERASHAELLRLCAAAEALLKPR